MTSFLSKKWLWIIGFAASLNTLAQAPILTFNPLNGASNVPTNAVLTISFNRDMQIIAGNTTLTSTNVDAQITLKQNNSGGPNIAFDATISNGTKLITITPSADLPAGVNIYLAVTGLETLSSDGDDDMSPATQSVTFSTDGTEPGLTFNPDDGDINVAVSSTIVISFDEPIRNTNDSDIDNTNVASLITFKLDNSGGANVGFTATINASDDEITITPSASLNTDQDYFVSLAPVEDISDNATSTESITFTTTDTQAPTPTFSPVNGATGVLETDPITITFTELIRRASDDATFTDTNIDAQITLKLNDASGANIPFNATIDDPNNMVITITPSSALPGNSIIYVALAGIEDGNNNAMTPDPASITFTTGDSQAPTITDTNPDDNEDPVSVSTTTLQITFNENIVFDNTDYNDDDANRIRIRNVTTSTFVETITLANINVTGNVVNITFTTSLAANTTYAIYVGNSVFEDAAGNDFAGINNNTTWNFDTEDAPNITGYSADPTCIGETINIQGTRFGTLQPTVTVNGITVVPSAFSNTSITITIPTTTTASNATVVVTNATNGLSDSDNTLTLKPAIATSIPIAPNPSSPAVNQPFDIEVDNSQIGVSYAIREVPPGGAFGTSSAGTGGTIDFGPYTKTVDGTYNFEIRATSAGCTQETYSLTINIDALDARAGADRTICVGDSTILGGTPATASGGTGFYSIKWYKLPSGSIVSTASNPVIKPTSNSVYRVLVNDGSKTDADTVSISVNQPTNRNDIDIILSPSNPNNTYQKETTDPVTLSFTVSGAPGTYLGSTRFEGPGVNSSGPIKYFFPNAADVGGNQIDLYYENAQGCVTKDSIQVFVRDKNLYINGLNEKYCRENSNKNLTVNTPVIVSPYGFQLCFIMADLSLSCSNYTFIQGRRYTYQNRIRIRNLDTNDTVSVASAFTYTNGNLTINPENLTKGKKQFEIFYNVELLNWTNVAPGYTVASAPFSEVVTVPFEVIEKPTVFFNNFTTKICENAASFVMSASPAGGTFRLNGSPSTSTFDPGTVGLPNNNIVRYTYTDPASTCVNYAEGTVTINRVPDITNIDFENGCVNDVIDFTPVFANTGGISFTYSWDIDGIEGEEIKVNSSTPETIHRSYSVASNYPVIVRIQTADNCTTERNEAITIGQVPDLKMSWSYVCDGDDTRFGFDSEYYKNNISDIDSVNWNFGDQNRAKKKSPIFSDSVKTHPYASTGYFDATVTLVTDLNCRITDTVRVYKVAKTVAIGNTEYYQDFNAASFETQGWKSGGFNSSWNWGVPAATKISDDNPGGGNAWVTNLAGAYNANEDSWVHSPCFNLSQIQRPVLSFDFRSLTRDGVDGVVLQYNSKSTTNKESDWKTLGNVGNGKNWYNRIAIGANPGNQALLQTGWTGVIDTVNWREATIPLDNILNNIPLSERNRVRFRFAFASSDFIPEAEGFAFDNFKIAQRDRLVLLEQFTNNGGNNTINEPNKVANQAINTFIDNSFGEVIKLEYHLGVSGPGEDPLYLDNTVDANARAAFYGVTTTPTSFIDSRHGNILNNYSEQTLKPASVTIDTIYTTNTPADKLNIVVQFTPKTNLPANSVLHIAVIENEIIVDEATGSNGENSFRYVMKKLLPNALGTRYPNGVPANTTETVSLSWSPRAYALDSLAIIAFVQNEETKEIYQTKYLRDLENVPTVITGIESVFAEQVHIFPNPATSSFNILLPHKAIHSLPVILIDGFGREVYHNQFNTGEQQKNVNTGDLSSGVYILQIKSPNGEVVRKKVSVTNR